MNRPLLAVTMGDPVGIGPEVLVKAASVPDVYEETAIVAFGDVEVLARAAREAAPSVHVFEVPGPEAVEPDMPRPGQLPVVSVTRLPESDFGWGRPFSASNRAQVEYIERAFEAVQGGLVDAIVTAPVNKASIRQTGIDFPGHTEMLARLTGCGPPVMMLAGPTLKAVPLTTHVPLRDVPGLLNIDMVLHAIEVTHAALIRYFGHQSPRVAVAGLNPHAGDGGLFGDEEARILTPAIEAGRAKGIHVAGPLPGDSVFHRAVTGEFDVVLGTYHDQALVPLKLLDFDRAVNVTLGLPVIRTSVDHGTAYDIAGRGVASASSMIAALRMAGRMVRDTRDSDAAPKTDG